MRSTLLSAITLALMSAPPCPALAQLLQTPEGPVEFVGLEDWTPEQVRDTLAVLAPGEPLGSGACAVILQREVGFPQAAVFTYRGTIRDVDDEYVVIMLVEPSNGHRVRYLDPPPDSLGAIEQWSEGYRLFKENRRAWMEALRGPRPEMDGEATEPILQVREFLRGHATEEDYRLALDVLRRDRDISNRRIAVSLLAAFPERDETWHALVRVLRGHDALDGGRSEAAVILEDLAWNSRRTVVWAPAAEDLRALIDGTYLFGFLTATRILSATEVSPDMAGELLGGGGDLVLASLNAQHPHLRQTARQLLVQISGQDLGEDVEAWRNWIASLPQGG